jgi:hypothetical protein
VFVLWVECFGRGSRPAPGQRQRLLRGDGPVMGCCFWRLQEVNGGPLARSGCGENGSAFGGHPLGRGSVHQSVPQRVTNDLGVVGQFQFLQDVLAVGADRFDAEGKLARNVLDPLSPSHQ